MFDLVLFDEWMWNSLVQGNVDDVHSGADHQRASFILCQTQASETWKDGFRTFGGHGQARADLCLVSFRTNNFPYDPVLKHTPRIPTGTRFLET